MTTALGIIVGVLVILLGVFIRATWRISRVHLSLNEEYSSLRDNHATLREQYNRVQYGYQQGVAEGMGKAYANLRAGWTDRLMKSTPQERAFLLTWHQSPMADWEKARVMMNTELNKITGPDNDVNYNDYVKSDASEHIIVLKTGEIE